MAQAINQDESLLELFVFETTQNTQQLEQIVLNAEREGHFSPDEVNDVFRIMHTIKGSSAMMSYSEIAALAHQMEDLFSYIRGNVDAQYDSHAISDLILACMDYINRQLDVVREGGIPAEGGIGDLGQRIGALMADMVSGGGPAATEAAPVVATAAHPQRYRAVLMFEEGCEMEDVRAYSAMVEIAKYAKVLSYEPTGIMEDPNSTLEIRENGFLIHIETDLDEEEVRTRLYQTVLLRDADLVAENESGVPATQPQAAEPPKAEAPKAEAPKAEAPKAELPKAEASKAEVPKVAPVSAPAQKPAAPKTESNAQYHQQPQSIISVSVNKLDLMMDLMGELVIAKTMVADSPEVRELNIADFKKSAAHLSKIVTEMQELVMSMRLVPLSTSFHRMQRVVRDMSNSLGKQIDLVLVGEETSVDKNVIEHIGDPLIHLVRNAIDHGIETAQERAKTDKPAVSTLTLEAENAGGHVLISVTDDGRGLNREKILKRARENNLLKKPEAEYTEREINNLIFLPGFSTNDTVTEYSGRGVGMDVVMQNITTIGGSVSVDSEPGKGTKVTLKIPLTIAILDGMNVLVGDTRLTLPISAICESFKPRQEDILYDVEGNEMVMVRGDCYAVIRLHRQWGVDTNVTRLPDGILIMVEQDGKKRCVFADRLVGRQQVVVKTLPNYLKRTPISRCLSGLTLLSDGSISLILDAGWLVDADIKGKENGGI
jgi:two-component system chemotaxis sensor kinase CheA